MLKQRIIIIILLAPVFIASVLLLNNHWFKLLLSAVLLIGAFEWAQIAGVKKNYLAILYSAILIFVAFFSDYFSEILQLKDWIYWVSVFWWTAVFVWIVLSQYKSVIGNFSCNVKLAMGFLTLLPTWHALIDLHAIKQFGPWLALYLITLVWFADIGAYVVGKLIGKRKLAPALSPGKTIEGVIGGLTAVILLSLGALLFFTSNFVQSLIFVFISVIVAVFSVVGDLFESVLKRQAGVKDSGKLLPGHGGVLDRIDSLTTAAPIFLVGFSLFLS